MRLIRWKRLFFKIEAEANIMDSATDTCLMINFFQMFPLSIQKTYGFNITVQLAIHAYDG